MMYTFQLEKSGEIHVKGFNKTIGGGGGSNWTTGDDVSIGEFVLPSGGSHDYMDAHESCLCMEVQQDNTSILIFPDWILEW